MKVKQQAGGTTAESNAYTGSARQITVDTDRHELRVHDGATAGGHRIPTLTALALLFMSVDSEFGGTAFDAEDVGFLTRIDDKTYTNRAFTAGDGLSWTYADGVDGAPLIDLDEVYLESWAIDIIEDVIDGTKGAAASVSASLFASVTEFRDKTAQKILDSETVFAGAAFVSFAGTSGDLAWDQDDGFNFTVTLSGDATIVLPSNPVEGQCGVIEVIQDGSGGHTLSMGTGVYCMGEETLDIPTDAGSIVEINYRMRSAANLRLYPPAQQLPV